MNRVFVVLCLSLAAAAPALADTGAEVSGLARVSERASAVGDAGEAVDALDAAFEALDALPWAVEGAVEPAGRIRYEVAPGDTLSEIAAEYGVTVENIQRWNNLDGDSLRVGQMLTIRTSGRSSSRSSSDERVRTTYEVRSGDTATTIARRHGASLAEMQRWNRRTNLDRLRIGQELVIYVADSGSGSTGSPNRGRLRGGVLLEEGTGYRVRNAERAYGTPGTVAAIRNGIARVQARFIEVPDLVIHDLSFQRGGRMNPHASHQNGLDADVTYYRTNCEDGECSWRAVEPEELDVQLNWYLFRTWIEQGVVEYIFMNYELQAPLYEYARERGATDEQLAEWFEYPNRGGGRAVIRHESGHDDHFHVRFRNLSTAD